MKKLFTILLVFICGYTYSQTFDFYTRGSFYKSMRVYDSATIGNLISTNTTNIALKLNKTDSVSGVANNWVTQYQRKKTSDSIVALIGAGGASSLQAVTAIGSTTTYSMYSLDSIKSYDFYSSGGAMFSDSTMLGTDSIYYYGASIETGTSGITAGGTRWTTKVSANLGAVEVNRAIAATSFRRKPGNVAGDSAFMDRLTWIPTYRNTLRFFVFGGSNILNDMSFSIGLSTLAAAMSAAIDTIHLNRGWPLNKIVVALPSLCGTYAGGSNDSLRMYVSIALATAKTKGVQYVDNYTYTTNNGGVTLLNSDSIHPNNAGHYQMSEGFTYRISDVKVLNSLRANRNILAKGNVSVGNRVTMVNTTSGTTGNVSGQFNWGQTGMDGNGLLLYDAGSTSLRDGIGVRQADATMAIFARGYAEGIQFGLNQDATTLTPANSHFYLYSTGGGQGAGTPAANGTVTVFNGNVRFSDITPTRILFPTPSTTQNAVGTLSFGTATAVAGIRPLNGANTTLRTGFVYDGANTGQSFLFGRGSLELMFGVGFDETNLTTTNSAFYISTVNTLVANGLRTSYVAKTGTYAAGAGDYTIDCTSNTFTVTLPTAVGVSGRIYVIKNSGTGVITIATTSSQTIDGVTTKILNTQYAGYTLQSDNANWKIISTF